MPKDILVIADVLVEPPSEILPFRTITMISHDNLGMDVLLHSTQEMKDFVYQFAKLRGLMDFVDYILDEREREDGVRIDIIGGVYPNTIIVKWIRIENQLSLIGRIRSMTGK